MSKRATRSESTYSKGIRCYFPPPLDVVILPLLLVRNPIVGCEGTGMGRFYNHRIQPMGRFSNVVLGTKSFIEGNIEVHRGTTIFYRGSLLKHPYSRDMTIFR